MSRPSIFLLLMVPTSALAQTTVGGYHVTSGAQPGSTYTAPSASTSTARHDENAARQTEEDKNAAQMDQVRNRLKAQFEASQPYLDAQTQLKQAQADYDAAQKSVLDAVRSQPQ